MASHGSALHVNFDVDYVVVFRFTDTSIALMSYSSTPRTDIDLQIMLRQSKSLKNSHKLLQGRDCSWKSAMGIIFRFSSSSRLPTRL